MAIQELISDSGWHSDIDGLERRDLTSPIYEIEASSTSCCFRCAKYGKPPGAVWEPITVIFMTDPPRLRDETLGHHTVIGQGDMQEAMSDSGQMEMHKIWVGFIGVTKPQFRELTTFVEAFRPDGTFTVALRLLRKRERESPNYRLIYVLSYELGRRIAENSR